MTKENDRNRRRKARDDDSKWEVIRRPITSIHEANKVIVADAREKVASFNWAKFGKLHVDPRIAFDTALPIVLRNSKVAFSLTALNIDRDEEKEILDHLPPQRKKHFFDNYYLVTTVPEIDPQSATFTRDWLLIKGPESVALLNGLDLEEVVQYFGKNEQSMRTAAFRVYEQMRGIE